MNLLRHAQVILSSGVFILLISSALRAENVQFFSVDMPPFSYTDQYGQSSGYAADVIKKLLSLPAPQDPAQFSNQINEVKRADEVATEDFIQSIPLARSQQILQRSTNAGVLPILNVYSEINKSESGNMPINTFKDVVKASRVVGPLAKVDVKLYSRSNEAQVIHSFEDMKKLRSIGVVKGDAFHRILLSNDFQNIVAVPEGGTADGTNLLFQMLMSQRVDSIIMNQASIKHAAASANFNLSDLNESFNIGTGFIYLALTEDVPVEQINMWNQQLQNMLANNQLADIYRKYIAFDFKLPTQQDFVFFKTIADSNQ